MTAAPVLEATADGPDYDAGDFKPGDRIRVITDNQRHMGALGRVTKIDDGQIFPVVVWLDVFGTPSKIEASQGIGLPLCAGEVEKVNA